jgi:hypothetical protein
VAGATSSLLPESFQSYLDTVLIQLNNTYAQLPPSAREYLHTATKEHPGALAGTALAVVAAAAASMSRWGWGERFSPFSSRGSAPNVTDDDFSYITSSDLDQPSRGGTYDPTYRTPPSMQPEDDVILVRCKGVIHPIKFPAYSISDGKLEVRDLKKRAAEATGISRGLALLYKGTRLSDDFKPCREYNLKNQSEVMCVIRDDDEGSEDDGTDSGVGSGSRTKKKKRVRRSKKGGKSSGSGGSGGSNSSPTPPADPNSPLGKIEAIASHFHAKILPQCIQYTASPPSDAKKRDFEYKRLGEAVLVEVILKLDAVEIEGDAVARQRRKDLVKETQVVLSQLDANAGGMNG